MKKLSKNSFEKASQIIKESARPLEKLIYQDYFHQPCQEEIVSELKKYQNNDGGFGHGIEPDFRLPLSSPMASSVAFHHLMKYDLNDESIGVIKSGIKYFENAFIPECNGWFVLSKEVNDYPHAPWWHFNEKEGMTVIDKNWGNPSAEIIGYLYKYRDFVSNLNIEELLNFALDYWNNKSKFASENEIYCYISLYNIIPDQYSKMLESKISEGIQQHICKEVADWKDKYVPKPLDFVTDPESNRFGISDELIEKNLDLWVDILTENKKLEPTWAWNDYKDEWKKARNEWTGLLTLNALICLNKFGRIEI